MVLPFSISLPSKSKKQSHLTATNFLKRQKMEVTFDITKFYSLKINSDIILVKPHKTSQGKEGRPTHVCSTAIYWVTYYVRAGKLFPCSTPAQN